MTTWATLYKFMRNSCIQGRTDFIYDDEIA